ncbi:hypothetical protein FRC03_001116 [Tulasnella sp. 419]|nr:hypothetical protein FRC03_001116 [Tulasnella sp. 419]
MSKWMERYRQAVKAMLWIAPAMVINENVVTIKSISGSSMQPTMNPRDRTMDDVVILDRLSAASSFPFRDLLYKGKPPIRHGDIVVLRSPVDPNLMITKRVIAMEHDMVKTLPPYPESMVKIPQGHIWVEGDEPFRSNDSNTFGPVSMGLVDSKVRCIIWPLHRFGAALFPHSLSSPRSSLGPGGPERRQEMDAIAREKRWRSRVLRHSLHSDTV